MFPRPPRRLSLCALFPLLLAAAWSPCAVHAHMGSTSYLTLRIEGDELRGQWDMALIDLDLEVELDANADNTISTAEFEARRREAEGYAISNVVFNVEGSVLPLRFSEFLREEFTDGSYAVLRFTAPVPSGARTLAVTYTAFFEKDPLHRGLVRLETAEGGDTSIFNPHAMTQAFDLGFRSPGRQFLTFLHEGAHHIWIGIDHILFLLALPIAVAAAGLAREWLDATRARPRSEPRPERRRHPRLGSEHRREHAH